MKQLLYACAVAALALCVSNSAAAGQCSDPWVNQAVQQVTGHAPNGSGGYGDCNIQNYGGGHWSSYPDLVNKVRAHFASATAASGTCHDPWVTSAVKQVTGRAPNGSGVSGECDINRYGGGHWSSYLDLVSKVQAVFHPAQPAARAVRPEALVATDGQNSYCLAQNGGGLAAQQCSGGANAFVKYYYPRNAYVLHTGGGCLDASGGLHSPVRIAGCNNAITQDWYLNTTGQIQTKAYGNGCLDVEGGLGYGRRAMVWDCNGSSSNQLFLDGHVESAGFNQRTIPPEAIANLMSGGIVKFIQANGVIAAGGGNVIAAGGGNVIAAGGGNVIAPGGGN